MIRTPAVTYGSSVASPVRSLGLRGSGAVAPSAPDVPSEEAAPGLSHAGSSAKALYRLSPASR
jgi:hypothetical protein